MKHRIILGTLIIVQILIVISIILLEDKPFSMSFWILIIMIVVPDIMYYDFYIRAKKK